MKEEDIEEVTSRTNYRARSPGVKPVTGIKLVLPKTSKMAEKIEMVLGGDDPVKLKKMNRLVIGREEDEKEYRLEFKSAASREKFRKMMNEEVYNGHSVEDIKEAVASDPQGMVKGLSNKAKKEIADELNRMELSGYGDYMASPKNVHKFRPADLMAAMIKIMKLESLDEEKSLFDISPTSSKWMKGKLRVGYNQSQKSGMPKEMFKKGQVIDLHPFDGDRFVGAKSPKDKGSYFFVAKRHVDAMKEDVQLDEKKKPISTRLGDAFDSGELEDRIKSMSGPARKSFTNLANSLVDFYHTTKDIHQVDGRELEDKIDGSPPRVRKMFAKLLDESRDDFDYLDRQAASDDRAFAAKKFLQALKRAKIKAKYNRAIGEVEVEKKDLRKAQSIGMKLGVNKDGIRIS
ncbi:MAG: hypothetical protein VX998_07200, partial [Candidatus Thermoplasmatota archaeon]|nr:hypothetical protein [Candidatus Thermoplasmatota archaeon]